MENVTIDITKKREVKTLKNLGTKLKMARTRRRTISERRSLQTVLSRMDTRLRDELIDMHELRR